jgi:hypothetical protein
MFPARHRSVTLRRAVVRVAALAMYVVLLVTCLRGGSGYFYCPMMDSVSATSCCAGSEQAAEEDTPSIDQPDCCESRRLGTAKPTPVPSSVDVLDAPMTLVLHASDRFIAQAIPAATRTRFTHPVRAGPKGALERRAQLMVWNS